MNLTRYFLKARQRELVSLPLAFVCNGTSNPVAASNLGWTGWAVTRLGVGLFRVTFPESWGQVLYCGFSQFKGNGTPVPWVVSIQNIDQVNKRIDFQYYEEVGGTMTATDPSLATGTRLMLSPIIQNSLVSP